MLASVAFLAAAGVGYGRIFMAHAHRPVTDSWLKAVRYPVEKGADVSAVSRKGRTTVDMANGPTQRVSPFPDTIALLESLGAISNHNRVSR